MNDIPQPNNTAFIVVLSVIIAALLAGGGVYAYQKNQSNKTQSDLQSQIDTLKTQVDAAKTSVATPMPSPIAAVQPTSTPDSTGQTKTDIEQAQEVVQKFVSYYQARDNASLEKMFSLMTPPKTDAEKAMLNFLLLKDMPSNDGTFQTRLNSTATYGNIKIVSFKIGQGEKVDSNYVFPVSLITSSYINGCMNDCSNVGKSEPGTANTKVIVGQYQNEWKVFEYRQKDPTKLSSNYIDGHYETSSKYSGF